MGDYTRFWDDTPLLKLMAERAPGLAIGGPVLEHLRVNYWLKMRAIAEKDLVLRKTMPGMLVAPDKLAVHVGKSHLAIEYYGPAHVPAKVTDDGIKVTFTDYRDEGDLISNIIGMKFEGSSFKLPLANNDLSWNLFVPTSAEAITLMMDNGWDLHAENMAFAMNVGGLSLPEGAFARMVNCFFYSAENQRLRTRRIQWMDFFPLKVAEETDDTLDVDVGIWPDVVKAVEHDSHMQFPRPRLFENERLALLNRFRELILRPKVTEPQITSWLAEPANEFILKMAIPAVRLGAEKKCVWISDPSRKPLKPDFFAVRANGFADIVEFKLPELKGSPIVGEVNRETFSAEVSSYVAQTHFYREYFSETVNRDHVAKVHGIDVHFPKRFLIMGRRWQFDSKVWRSVASEFPDLTILTYDDLLDSVTAQLYQNPPPNPG